MNRLGLKLACVALAIVIWVQVASTADTEATLGLPKVEMSYIGG